MVRTKDLAESQFDFNAPSVNLGVKFDKFCDFELQVELFDQDADVITKYGLFSDEIDDLPVEPVDLVLLANDFDPQIRDDESEKFQQLGENDEQVLEFKQLTEEIKSEDFDTIKVDNIDFKIKHREFRDQVADFKPDNKVVTAFRLVSLAIDKLESKLFNQLNLEDQESDKEYYDRLALIDKSENSIRFINRLGFQVMDKIIKKFPDQFQFQIDEDAKIVKWLNEKSDAHQLNHILFFSAFISSKIKYSNIEINDYPALNFDIGGIYLNISTHQILRFMDLHTLNIKSTRFKNLKKFIFSFSLVYGGKRLFYLEKLISDAENGYLFFKSYENNFSELNGSFSDDNFPFYNSYAFKNLVRRIDDSRFSDSKIKSLH